LLLCPYGNRFINIVLFHVSHICGIGHPPNNLDIHECEIQMQTLQDKVLWFLPLQLQD